MQALYSLAQAQIRVKRFAHCPEGQLFRKHDTDAGYDLASADDIVIKPSLELSCESVEQVLFGNEILHNRYIQPRQKIRTGIAVEPSAHGYFAIVPRSGTGSKLHLWLANVHGVVDNGYQDEILIMAYNPTDFDIPIARGERIAQLIFIPLPMTELVEVIEFAPSARGTNGWGSSGTK